MEEDITELMLVDLITKENQVKSLLQHSKVNLQNVLFKNT